MTIWVAELDRPHTGCARILFRDGNLICGDLLDIVFLQDLVAASMSLTTMAICWNHASLLYEGIGIGRP